MCIGVFLWKSHPLYPLILLSNRDEFHNRPTEALRWWDGDDPDIVGGRDVVAGGTWLACNRSGKVAYLTNVRELNSDPLAHSRGHLPLRFLKGNKSPVEFGEEVASEAGQYNGFNLILADLCSLDMVYVTNRPEGNKLSITIVSPGVHVLSNASLDTPWPKCERLNHSFRKLLELCGQGEIPIKVLVDKLMGNTVKDDESMLPKIYPPAWEYQLSSIFVDTDTPRGRYGTRSTSALLMKQSDEIIFYERNLKDESWEENKISFKIEGRNQKL